MARSTATAAVQHRQGAGRAIRVVLGDDVVVVDRFGSTVDVPRSELAVLVSLAVAGAPVARRDLAASCAISEQTLRPALSRLPSRLGLDGSLHRVVRPRSGRIIAEADAVKIAEHTTLGGSTAIDVARRTCIGLGIVADHPLGRATIDALAAHLETRRAARDPSPADAGTATGSDPSTETAATARARIERALRLAGEQASDVDLALRQALAVAAVACSHTVTIDFDLAARLWRNSRSDDVLPLERLLGAFPDIVRDGSFEHPLEVAACQGLLARSDIAWLHAQAATLIERIEPADEEASIDVLLRRAHHASRSNDTGLAAEVAVSLRRAATAAARRGDAAAELCLLESALEAETDPQARIGLLLARGDALRRNGPWHAAVESYREADQVAVRMGNSARRAEIGLHLARITWEADLGAETDRLLRQVRPALGTDAGLAARVDLCLAGGTYQDGRAGTERIEGETIEAALSQVPAMVDPTARAWGLIHGRKALLGVAPPEASLAMADAIVADSGRDVGALAHGHQARLVDLLRLDRRRDAATTLRMLRRLPVASSEQAFSVEVATACFDLALGRYDGAAHAMAQARSYGDRLGGDTFDQITLAHAVWLAIARRDDTELTGLAAAAHEMAGRTGAGSDIWLIGSALLALAIGDHAGAVDAIDRLAGQGGLRELAPGPHRLPSLAVAALVGAECRHREPLDLGHVTAALDELEAEASAGVLVGWPTLFLGPKDRYVACAALASGDIDGARAAIGRALTSDRWWPAQLAASLRVKAEIEADAGEASSAEATRSRAEAIEQALHRRIP